MSNFAHVLQTRKSFVEQFKSDRFLVCQRHLSLKTLCGITLLHIIRSTNQKQFPLQINHRF